jgi:hypothetical protein
MDKILGYNERPIQLKCFRNDQKTNEKKSSPKSSEINEFELIINHGVKSETLRFMNE